MYLENGQKQDCFGCRACEEICPKKCITMKCDDCGFEYPQIDTQVCIDCGLCKKVCPINFSDFAQKSDEIALVGVYNNEETISKSSSGGAFTAIYESLCAKGYIVCGVKFTSDLKVVHDLASSIEQCEIFRKSKYVMSNTNGCFSKISQLLANGEKVLFTGTPCQCAALKTFLKVKNIDEQGLITVDLICHGGPSQTLFDTYISQLEEKHLSKACAYEFRYKKESGKVNSRSAKIVFDDGKEIVVDKSSDAFLKAYYGRLFYRSSCGSCKFAAIQRVSDLTIGDAWHIDKVYPQWDPLKGVSLILANTEKGKLLAQELKSAMQLYPIDVDWAQNNNQQLSKPTDMHKNRSKFFKLLSKKGFDESVQISMKRSFFERAVGAIKRKLR